MDFKDVLCLFFYLILLYSIVQKLKSEWALFLTTDLHGFSQIFALIFLYLFCIQLIRN